MNQNSVRAILILSIALLSCNADSGREGFSPSTVRQQSGKPAVVFHRMAEPNENAFTFLLPDGWKITGGITRVNPGNVGGSGNAIEAKLYMKLNSPDNIAGMGWLPDTRFFDIRRYPGQNMAASLFPEGSNYNGMTVMRILPPDEFVRFIAIPFAHPHAMEICISRVQALPELAEQYHKMSALMLGGSGFDYRAAIITFEYTENTIHYFEKMVCAIEDWGQAGAGLWSNKETWYVRAEKPVFNEMAPVFASIGQSVKINPEWMAREIRSQQMNSNTAIQTQQETARIDREIAGHRSKTNAEINNQMYLTLTAQEDFTNPFTGETERGTNEWNFRWENPQGDVIYHDNLNYNPNEDNNIRIKGFKRSRVKSSNK